MSRDHSSADAAGGGAADAVNDATPDAHSKESDDSSRSGDSNASDNSNGSGDSNRSGDSNEVGNANESDDRRQSDGESPTRSEGDAAGPGRVGRPLVAGAIGLLAGVVGGIAATTIAPGNLFLTILLIVVVVLVVTAGTLRVLTS